MTSILTLLDEVYHFLYCGRNHLISKFGSITVSGEVKFISVDGMSTQHNGVWTRKKRIISEDPLALYMCSSPSSIPTTPQSAVHKTHHVTLVPEAQPKVQPYLFLWYLTIHLV